MNLVDPFRFGGTAVDPNLVGWWKLNDGSGSTAVDSSGNSNDGTLVNSPTWVSGTNSNGALLFVSSLNQYVDIGNPSVLQITSDMTISVWFNLTTVIDEILIAKDGDTGGRAYTLDLNSGKVRFYIGGVAIAQTTTTVSSLTWYHIVGTYDHASSSGTLKIYLNSTLEGITTGTGTAIPTATANVLLARRIYVGFEGPFNGTLQDARIYNKTLTAGDVSALYAAGAQ